MHQTIILAVLAILAGLLAGLFLPMRDASVAVTPSPNRHFGQNDNHSPANEPMSADIAAHTLTARTQAVNSKDSCVAGVATTTLKYIIQENSSTDIQAVLEGVFINQCLNPIDVIVEIVSYGVHDRVSDRIQTSLPSTGTWGPGRHSFQLRNVFAYEPEVRRYQIRIIALHEH